MSAIEAQVLSALDGLGATSADVANTLQEQGIKGRRDHCTECPIAVYLAVTFPGRHFLVGEPDVMILKRASANSGPEVIEPAAVRGFVKEFDLGMYPQLDAREESS